MIKCIIFDFGGVLSLGSFYSVVARNIESRLNIKKEAVEKALRESEWHYATGKHTKEEFWKKVSDNLGIELDPEVCNNIFVNHSLELNHELLDELKQLKKKYKLILLSDNFKELADELKPKFKDYFDKMYFSNETGLVKPDKEAYLMILRENKLKPEECIFIDDKHHNVEGAKTLGIKTILFKNNNDLMKDLEKLL